MLKRRSQTIIFHNTLVLIICIIFAIQIYSVPTFPTFSYGNITKLVALLVFFDILRRGVFPMARWESYWFFLFLSGFLFSQIYGSGSIVYIQLLDSAKVFLFYIIIVYLFRTERDINRLLSWFVIVSFIVVLIAMIDTENRLIYFLLDHGAVSEVRKEDIFIHDFSVFTRRTFFNLDPNIFGGYLVLSILAVFYLMLTNTSNLWKWLLHVPFLVTAMAGLLKTGSRSTLLLFIICCAAFGILIGNKRIKRITIYTVSFVILLFMIASFLPEMFSGYKTMSMRFSDIGSFSTIYTEIIDVFSGNKAVYFSDTLASRILVGVLTCNNYLEGDFIHIIFGYHNHMGTISIPPGNHIGYIGWFTEYGLITFIPFIGLNVYLLRYLLILRKNYRYLKIESNKYYLVILAIGILVFFIVKQLSDPGGANMLKFFGIISAVITLCAHDIKTYKTRRKNLEKTTHT